MKAQVQYSKINAQVKKSLGAKCNRIVRTVKKASLLVAATQCKLKHSRVIKLNSINVRRSKSTKTKKFLFYVEA